MPHPVDENNPFQSASPPDPDSERISSDPAIQHEPHLRNDGFGTDESEEKAMAAIAGAVPAETDAIDHSVWDEPGLSKELAGPAPESALTYSNWMRERIQETSAVQSWIVTAGIAGFAGLFALLGAFLSVGSTSSGVLMICLFGPLTEEVMKSALAVWVVEKRPYLFKSPLQIAICAIASGFVFAFVENLLYLRVYIPNPTANLILWRWTVCVALHVGCTMIVGIGLIRIWSDTIRHHHRPRLVLGSPLIITAIVIHAVYNTAAVIAEAADFSF